VGPRWVIIENVPALRSRGFVTVLQNLSALGYDAEWHCIPASYVGAPHRRDRIWIVAYPHNERSHRINSLLRSKTSWQDKEKISETTRSRSKMANTSRLQQGRQEQRSERKRTGPGGEQDVMADTNSTGLALRKSLASNPHPECETVKRGSKQDVMADTNGKPTLGASIARQERHTWKFESRFCQFFNGLSQKMVEPLTKPISHCTLCIERTMQHGKTKENGSSKNLPRLRNADVSQANEQTLGRQERVHQTNILQSEMHGGGDDARQANLIRTSQESGKAQGKGMRRMRNTEQTPYPPPGHETREQRSEEPDDALRVLSRLMALEQRKTPGVDIKRCATLLRLWQGMAETEIRDVPETLSEIQKVWRSATDEEKQWWTLRVATGNPSCAEWPGVPRVAIGVKDRVNKLKCLGNAVVPQVVEMIGHAIMDMEREE